MAELIYREEPQSEINFGPFDVSQYYDIEKSEDIKISKGKAIKSVECVVVRNNKLLFIEAKKTAPKDLTAQVKLNKLAEMIQEDYREEYEKLIGTLKIVPSYVSDVCEKFIMSLCLVLSIAEGRIPSVDMPPAMLATIKTSFPVFILVVTWSRKDWICHVQDAFNIALHKFEKTNHIKVRVWTAEQAKASGIVSTYTPMPEDWGN